MSSFLWYLQWNNLGLLWIEGERWGVVKAIPTIGVGSSFDHRYQGPMVGATASVTGAKCPMAGVAAPMTSMEGHCYDSRHGSLIIGDPVPTTSIEGLITEVIIPMIEIIVPITEDTTLAAVIGSPIARTTIPAVWSLDLHTNSSSA